MSKSRFSDSKIMAVLKKAESGVPVAEICRENGISTALFRRWLLKQYGGHVENGHLESSGCLAPMSGDR